MGSLISSITLTDVVGVLLLVVSIWLIKIIVKREKEHLLRGLMVFLLFLAAFLYLNQSAGQKWTVSDFKARFFPEKQVTINYRMETGVQNNNEYVQYIFKNPLPPISLSMGGSGDFFRINNVTPVNRILRQLDLPLLETGTPEQASVTGSSLDASTYRWENYPPGVLILEETLVQGRGSLTTYHGVVRITIQRRF